MPLTLPAYADALNASLPDGAYHVMLLEQLGESIGLDASSVTTGSAAITAPGNTLQVGSGVVFSTSGTLYSPLLPNVAYRVVVKGPGDQVQLSMLPGGDPIVITSAGSGTHSLTSLQPVEAVGGLTIVAFSMADLVRYEIPTYASGQRPTTSIMGTVSTPEGRSKTVAFTVNNLDGDSTVEFNYAAFVRDGSGTPGDAAGVCRAVVTAVPFPVQVPAGEQRDVTANITLSPR